MLKIDPIPKRQLLGFQIRGPELRALFDEIQNSGPMTYSQICERFVPPPEPRKDELLKEGLDALRALELIWRVQPDEGETLYQVSDDVSADIPFDLLILEKLRGFDDTRRVFHLVHDLIVANDWVYINLSELLEELERDYPQTEYAWNTEKLRTWRDIAKYFGLIRNVKSGAAIVSPTPDLLFRLLMAYAAHGNIPINGKFEIPIQEWLSFLQTRYCRCFTDRQRVHGGLAQALLSMEAKGQINLTMLSDAGSVGLTEKSISHIELATVSG